MSEMQIFLSVKRVVSQEFFIFTGGDSGDDFLDHHTRDGVA